MKFMKLSKLKFSSTISDGKHIINTALQTRLLQESNFNVSTARQGAHPPCI